MTDNKIARICWNSEKWRKPSGPRGKSKNEESYEYRFGFGHEEWLLDITKLIDGWHYAYLQPIGLHHQRYIGQTFNISLYSIDYETKKRWWVGTILDVEVIAPEQSSKAYLVYKEKGWLNEMEQQLDSVKAETSEFKKINPDGFAVIRYQPENLKILDIPLEFATSDPAVRASYYVLLNQEEHPKLSNKFVFSAGHKSKKSASKVTYEEHSSEFVLLHNVIQTDLYNFFCKNLGKDYVSTENNSGLGDLIDVVVKDRDNKCIFYEIKTNPSVRLCVREALGQLLEYAFYPKEENAKKLVIVSQNRITQDVSTYLQQIRDRLNVPIYYQRFDLKTKALEDIEH